jgi:hypothetical protein
LLLNNAGIGSPEGNLEDLIYEQRRLAVEWMNTDERGMISAMQPYGEVAEAATMEVENVANNKNYFCVLSIPMVCK